AQRIGEIVSAVRATFTEHSGQVNDPLAAHLLQKIDTEPPRSRREWIDLERAVEELHLLSPILARTRKRDVQEHAPERRAKTHKCEWSAEEKRAYCHLLGVEAADAWPDTRMGLGMVTRSRWAASCLPAAIEASHAEHRDESWEESVDVDREDIE